MKLAVASLIYKLTTLQSKGGAEVWVSNFVTESARRNHKIDLYAVDGSIAGENIRLISSLDKPVAEYYQEEFFKRDGPMTFGWQSGEFAATVYARLVHSIVERAEEYDIVIDSTASPVFTFNTDRFNKPLLTIGHDPPDFIYNFYARAFGWSDNNLVVFPSKYQFDRAYSIPESNRIVITHGIDLNALTQNSRGGEHIRWMSRIDYPRQDKGMREAMLVANELGRELHLTGLVEREARSYVETDLMPLMTSNIKFEEQEVELPTNKTKMLGDARLFIFPTQWEESFGIVLLEAMACGTPVVAYARGAIPEVISDGVTGYVVNPSDKDVRGDFIVKKTGVGGLCEAVEKIYAMNREEYEQMRKNCRAWVEEHFTVERMVDQYEQLYKKLVG